LYFLLGQNITQSPQKSKPEPLDSGYLPYRYYFVFTSLQSILTMGYIQDRLEQDRKIAEATRVLLVPESNLDKSDPESLLYQNNEEENYLN